MRERTGAASPRAAGAAAALLLGAGCVSYDVTLDEFDSVSGIAGADAWPRAVDYRDDPERLSWILRRLSSFGPTRMVVDYTGAEPIPSKIENPSGFARDSFAWLAEHTDGDLQRTAQVAARLLWVAELDREQPYNQALAIAGLGRLLGELGGDPREMRFADPAVATEERIAAWLAALDAGWPASRKGSQLEAAEHEAYLGALRAITERPLPTPPPATGGAPNQVVGADQRALIRALAQAAALEVDPALVEPTREALRRALYHGSVMALHRALYEPSPLVREAAIRALHRLGGPDAVPFVLALIEKPSAVDPSTRYDEDRLIRLALVRMCGQLDEARAMRTHEGGPAPVELLYETFFGDPDPGLRPIALQALAQVLGRPVDFDGAWAERWWREDYVPNRKAVSDR